MKYPKAGDVQRELGSHLTGNPATAPAARANPWEVRSDIGLEGIYDGEREAQKAAAQLRKQGARGVTAQPKGAPPRHHAPRGLPPGLPQRNPKPNPNDTYESEIVEGMARAIWVTSYADWVESMTKAERMENGDVPVNLGGIDWSEEAPPNPPDDLAARDLYAAYTKANAATTLSEIFEAFVDDAAADPEDFGHNLAMMALDTGVSWFDDHPEFDLKVPGFEANYIGEEGQDGKPLIEHSPSSRQNPEGDDDWFREIGERSAAETKKVLDAIHDAPCAVMFTDGGGTETLVLVTGEMSNPEEGKWRATMLRDDGPLGHITRRTIELLAKDLNSDLDPKSMKPVDDAFIMKFATTKAFAEGVRRCEMIREANARGARGNPAKRRRGTGSFWQDAIAAGKWER